MLLNPPSPQMSGNNIELIGSSRPAPIDGDPEDRILNDIKKVCYEFRGGPKTLITNFQINKIDVIKKSLL